MVGLYQRSYLRAFMTSVTAPPSYWHLYVPVLASIHNNLAHSGFSPERHLDASLKTVRRLPLAEEARQGIAGWSFPHFYELELCRFSDKTHVSRDSTAQTFRVNSASTISSSSLIVSKLVRSLLAGLPSAGSRKFAPHATYEVHDILRGSTIEFQCFALPTTFVSTWNYPIGSASSTQYNISHISEFDICENELKCLIHFRRSKRDSEWASVRTWYSRFRFIFHARGSF